MHKARDSTTTLLLIACSLEIDQTSHTSRAPKHTLLREKGLLVLQNEKLKFEANCRSGKVLRQNLSSPKEMLLDVVRER